VTPGERAASLDLATVRELLAGHDPGRVRNERDTRGWQAATALVLAPGAEALELALIRRAERRGDAWSGHMALPGGRRDPEDADLVATAVRETQEEVGLRVGDPVARLGDHRGRTRPGVVATYVFTLDEKVPLVPETTEVAAAEWVPLPALYDPAAATRYRAAGMRFPGVQVPHGIVWGLTYGTLKRFGEAVGLPFPPD
jgi:8-oxo-dGTP pyrophosphatase MutT (NUDIX family)